MTAYHLAKIRAKLARMLPLEGIPTWGREELLERLGASPYGRYLGEELDPAALRRACLDDLATLFHSLYGRDRALLDAVLAHWRVENLKLIVRAKVHNLPREEVEPLLFPIPWDDVDYRELLGAPGIEALAKALPWPEYARRLTVAHQQVGDRAETFPYEATLEDLYLDRLISFAVSGGNDVRPLLRNRALRSLFLWVFRLRGYGFSFPEMVNVLPDFRVLIPQEELRRMVEDPEGWQGVAAFLSPRSADELSRRGELDLGLLGELFDADLVEAVRWAFVAYPFGMGVVVGYALLKDLELRRLVRAVETARRG